MAAAEPESPDSISSADGSSGRPAKTSIALGSILLAAAALRLYGMGARPRLWEDEVAFLEYVLTGNAFGVPHEAPLYAWLQYAWMAWIQQPTPNTMRLLSIGPMTSSSDSRVNHSRTVALRPSRSRR